MKAELRTQVSNITLLDTTASPIAQFPSKGNQVGALWLCGWL